MSRHFHGTQPARCIALLANLLALCAASAASAAPSEIAKARAELTAAYAASLENLARWCDEHDLPEQARATRDWLLARDPLKLYLVVLPEQVGPAALPADASPDLIEWDKRFRAARNGQASTGM